jgi:hypothetical protein
VKPVLKLGFAGLLDQPLGLQERIEYLAVVVKKACKLVGCLGLLWRMVLPHITTAVRALDQLMRKSDLPDTERAKTVITGNFPSLAWFQAIPNGISRLK